MDTRPQLRSQPYRRQPYFVHQVRGLNEAEDLSSSGYTPLEFRPLSKTSIDLRIEGGLAGGLHLWSTRSQSGFVTVPSVDAALFSIRFVTSGSLVRRNAGQDVVAMPGIGLLQAFDLMRIESASNDFEAITATIDHSTLAAHYHALEGGEEGALPNFAPIAETTIPGVRAFMHSLLLAHARLRTGEPMDDISAPLVQEIMIYQFLGAWPRRSGREPSRRLSPPADKLRVALDYIEANIGSRLRVSDIAGACGMSVRSLQLLFKREIGKTIVQTIYEIRLDSVHGDLLSEEGMGLQVSQIAQRWGLAHMSDFSRRYRQRFGYPPSQTRHRRSH